MAHSDASRGARSHDQRRKHWRGPCYAHGRLRAPFRLILLTLASPTAATAQALAGLPHLDLTYDAPVECPARESCLERVRLRLGARTLEERPKQLLVKVRPDAEGYAAELTAPEPEKPALTRSVSAPSCDEVVDALALIAVLALDPTDERKPDPPPPPPLLLEEREAPVSSPPPPSRWRWSGAVGAQTELVGGVAPGPLLGFPIYIELRAVREQLLAPSVRLAFVPTRTSTAVRAEGSAHFRWTLGRLEACPVEIVPRTTIHLRPCARVDAGVVYATGDLRGNPRDARRGWVSVAALARAQWVIAQPLAVELGAGGVVPLTADTFYFQPADDVYKPGTIGVLANVSIDLRIW
jgi:hypothetical protein